MLLACIVQPTCLPAHESHTYISYMLVFQKHIHTCPICREHFQICVRMCVIAPVRPEKFCTCTHRDLSELSSSLNPKFTHNTHETKIFPHPQQAQAHARSEMEHDRALGPSRDDATSYMEGEQNPPRLLRDSCNTAHRAWDWGGASAAPIEWCSAIAQRPACRALVCEVAGACVREGVLAVVAGFRGSPGIYTPQHLRLSCVYYSPCFRLCVDAESL
jgi:hypothetical protein